MAKILAMILEIGHLAATPAGPPVSRVSCPSLLAPADDLPTEAAVRRLVVVTLGGLRRRA